jgi:hypothetical protein
MRRLIPAITGVALIAMSVAVAPPASAKVAASVKAIRLSAPYAKAPTDIVVVAKLTQTSYENISLNIVLDGFRANRTFAYGERSCPTSVAVVDAPLTVFECGWNEEDGAATLRLALEGTMPSGKVKIRIASGAVTAPAKAGDYDVSMSSWAFSTVTTEVAITSGPLK